MSPVGSKPSLLPGAEVDAAETEWDDWMQTCETCRKQTTLRNALPHEGEAAEDPREQRAWQYMQSWDVWT